MRAPGNCGKNGGSIPTHPIQGPKQPGSQHRGFGEGGSGTWQDYLADCLRPAEKASREVQEKGGNSVAPNQLGLDDPWLLAPFSLHSI